MSADQRRAHTAGVGVHMNDARAWFLWVCAVVLAACGGDEDRSGSRDSGPEPVDASEPRPWSLDSGVADASAPRDAAPSQRVQRDGAAPSASYDAGPQQPVTIRFRAQIFDREFRCGERYSGMGKTGVTADPSDLRFFVQDLRLIDQAGNLVSVTLTERAPWQVSTVALLDFADERGACSQGSRETNDLIEGSVPVGVYRGIAFRNGVPERLNHEDPLLHPPPLQATDLTWGWLTGFKFFVAELRQTESDDDAGAPKGFGLLHIGSADCNGSPKDGSARCNRANRNDIRLEQFDAEKNVIVVDVGKVFANTDLSQDTQCHSDKDLCQGLFEQVGVNWVTGRGMDTQQVYRVE